jgi:glycosyltransferase involved in cell wall biosynthesis
MLPNVSIIICAYTEDRWDELLDAVRSIQSQTVLAHEIIVVIDHNPQLLARAQVRWSDVIVVENHEPRGLSGARNSGLKIAHGQVIAFMDEDAIAAPDWLAGLLVGYDDPRVQGVGGAIEPLWHNNRPGWFPEEFDWVVGCTYRGMPETAKPVRNLIGCNMSFRREVFETVGGFRSGIGRIGTHPIGCEETELCIRANQHWPDRIFLFEPRARVRHRVPANRATWRYFRSRCYAEGRSKAQVARFVGAKDGLASEQTYTLKTLPQGVLRGLMDFARDDVSGLGRAVSIVSGLLMTSTGYVVGHLALRRAARANQRQTVESESVEASVEIGV